MQAAKSNVVIAPTFDIISKLTVIAADIALSINNVGKHFPHCLLSMQRGLSVLGSMVEKLLVHCYRYGAFGQSSLVFISKCGHCFQLQ
nr:hypothetical protein CFP56_69004 [Quercus suber]